MKRLTQRVHQAAGGAHGKPDGKNQTEPQQLAALVGGHILQIGAHHTHHVGWQQRRQHRRDTVDIQLQNTQQRADEDQQRKQGKQQIVCQGRAVPGHIMGVVPADHVLRQSSHAGLRRIECRCFHKQSSLRIFIVTQCAAN